MSHQQSDPEPPPESDSPRKSDKGAKYLPLLEAGSEDNFALWQEFRQDIKQGCRRMWSLTASAEDWAQEVVLRVYQNLSGLREKRINPWHHALRVLKNISHEANRKLERERRTISLTPSDLNERLGSEEGEILHGLLGHAATAEPPVVIRERQEDEKERGVDDESQARFKKIYEQCLTSSILSLPDESERMLYEDYYALKTHDAEAKLNLVVSYHLSSYDHLQVKIHRTVDKIEKAVLGCMSKNGYSLSDNLNEKQRREMIRRNTRNLYHGE